MYWVKTWSELTSEWVSKVRWNKISFKCDFVSNLSRVSIPCSVILPAYRYKAHRRGSFDPSDGLDLPSVSIQIVSHFKRVNTTIVTECVPVWLPGPALSVRVDSQVSSAASNQPGSPVQRYERNWITEQWSGETHGATVYFSRVSSPCLQTSSTSSHFQIPAAPIEAAEGSEVSRLPPFNFQHFSPKRRQPRTFQSTL